MMGDGSVGAQASGPELNAQNPCRTVLVISTLEGQAEADESLGIDDQPA